MFRASVLLFGTYGKYNITGFAYVLVRHRGGDVGCGSGYKDNSDDPCGFQFQPFGAEEEEGRTRPRHGRNLQISATSELLWIFLVGIGDAGGDGECGLFGWVCGRVVEVLSEED